MTSAASASVIVPPIGILATFIGKWCRYLDSSDKAFSKRAKGGTHVLTHTYTKALLVIMHLLATAYRRERLRDGAEDGGDGDGEGGEVRGSRGRVRVVEGSVGRVEFVDVGRPDWGSEWC